MTTLCDNLVGKKIVYRCEIQGSLQVGRVVEDRGDDLWIAQNGGSFERCARSAIIGIFDAENIEGLAA
jgi:hypothetical protein